MAHYRLYLLGPDGRIATAFDLDCADDREAQAQAEARTVEGFELWRRDKLIVTRPPPKAPL